MIEFLLMVNKQGQTRLAHYTKYISIKERITLEGELIRKCLSLNNKYYAFFIVEHKINTKDMYHYILFLVRFRLGL